MSQSTPPPPYPPIPDPYADDPGVPYVMHDPRCRRAAVAVWVSAGLMLLGSICCVGVMGAMGVVPLDEFRAAEGMQDVPDELWDDFATARPYLPAMAIVTALFTVLPAMALLILGFSVKRGRRGATLWAMILSIALLAMLGLTVLMVLVGFAMSGSVDVCSLLPILGLAGAMAWAVVSLKGALAATRAGGGGYSGAGHSGGGHSGGGRSGMSPDDDPWEHSL